jgi:DNA-binding MarR family transcriptional regulator
MSTSSTPDPADQLAQLVHGFNHAFSRWTESLLESSGVSTSRMRLLGALHCKGPQIMCDLGEELGVTARNVTTLVDGLESEALVRRAPHPTDRRATVVELTPAGFEMAEKLLGPFHAQLTGLFRDLPEGDQRELVRLLETLLTALRQRGQGCGNA